MRLRLGISVIILFGIGCNQNPGIPETIVDPIAPVPSFPGGPEGLNHYLKENYTWQQGQLTIEGTVFVEFMVLKDGSVTEAMVVRGLCETCDTEALRLTLGMPKWEPALQNGTPIKTKMILPIRFGLTNPYD